jgi:hypothetical protein
MSVSANFPAIRPSLLLDFANTERLDPRITFTRTTTATYYDGVTTAKAEENLLLYSQEFNNAAWTIEGVTRSTFDTETAPDGTSTADTILETSTTSAHRLDEVVSSSGVVTLSIFAKLGVGTRYLTIGVSRDTTNTASATFDLSGGTNTQTQANGTYSSPSATITAVAQSFYRCTLTVTTDTVSLVRVGLNDTSTPTTANRAFGASYTGDSTSTLIFWGAQLEQRSAVTAYTPTTTQAITNYIPVLKTAAAGVARFDHNPTTGESLGLLVEEQRTNLLTYSEDFDNAAWTKGNSSITANTIIAPDGTLTGDKLVENTATTTHTLQITTNPTYTSGTSYTWSVYVKAGERYLGLFTLVTAGTAFGSVVSATFDLQAGTITAASGSPTVGITQVGNGWFRLSISKTAVATVAEGGLGIRLYNASGQSTYTGDGYSGIYIWGAQLEAGAFPTSYIATTSATVTRNADAASMTGTNFSSWYRADEGTLYGDVKLIATTATGPVAFGISDGSTANALYGGQTLPTQVRPLGVRANSTDQAFPSVSVTVAPGYEYKFSGAYKFNDIAGAINGVAATTDTNALVPVVNQARIGGVVGATQPLNGTIKKLAFYPARLTDAQLQALTS